MSKEKLAKVIKVDIQDELKESFRIYSTEVLTNRAIPDVRDGLKPVQRSIIYGMYKEKVPFSARSVKSAKLVGSIMGNYHPHGDSAIYKAMVRMGQEWTMSSPLIHIDGNNGSVDGDPAAAMRYTEAKLGKASDYLIGDIAKKSIIEWEGNYDDTLEQPKYLPAEFPNLLVNGTYGISVGYASAIPTHNITEAIDSCVAILENKHITLRDLPLRCPDFPGGGVVVNGEDLLQMYEKGEGSIVLRGRYKLEEVKRGSKKIKQLVFFELPYSVKPSKLALACDDLLEKKKVNGMVGVRDESGSDGIRVVMELDKNANPEVVAEVLYKHTELEKKIEYSFNCIVEGELKTLGLLDYFKAYLRFRLKTVYKIIQSDIAELEHKLNQVSAMIIALQNSERVIQIIKGSANKSDARAKLMEELALNETQANYILNISLSRFTKDNVDKYIKEKEELETAIAGKQAILNDEDGIRKETIKRFMEVREATLTPRRTGLVNKLEKVDISSNNEIQLEDVVVGVKPYGEIKRSTPMSYSRSTKDEEELSLPCTTHDTVVVFTDLGRYLYLPVHTLVDKKWSEKGELLVNIDKDFQRDEKVITITKVEKNDRYFLLTKNGRVKTFTGETIDVKRYTKGYPYMKLKDDDRVIQVDKVRSQYYVGEITKTFKTKPNLSQFLFFNIDGMLDSGRASSGKVGLRTGKSGFVNSIYEVENVPESILSEIGKGTTKLDDITELVYGVTENEDGEPISYEIPYVHAELSDSIVGSIMCKEPVVEEIPEELEETEQQEEIQEVEK